LTSDQHTAILLHDRSFNQRSSIMTSRRPPSPATVLVLASGAAFLAMLDATVANLAVPDLAIDFPGNTVADLSWVITAYAVAFAAALAPAGRLADTIGRRRLYIAGVGLFTAMSALAAAAPTIGLLVAARAVQGIGAAAMIPASLAVLLAGVPAARRAGAIGAWSAASALAAAIGPSIGGVLVEAFGWPSLFVINVPLGVALVVAARGLPADERLAGARFPDLVGSALLGGGIAVIVLAVTQGDRWGWSSAGTIAGMAGGLLAMTLAVRRSQRHPAPAVETTLWRSPRFAVANVAAFGYGIALYSWMFLGVLFLTGSWGYSELRAGFAMSPGAAFAAMGAVAVGRLAGRISPRLAVGCGALLFAAGGALVVAVAGDDPSFLTLWLPVSVIAGSGVGAITTGLSSAAVLSAPPAQFAGATGSVMTARQIGGALGVAIAAVIVDSSSASGAERFRPAYVFSTVAVAVVAVLAVGVRGRAAAAAPVTAAADHAVVPVPGAAADAVPAAVEVPA
jgi:EmrB/QacA subfamily drug resistance transporter